MIGKIMNSMLAHYLAIEADNYAKKIMNRICICKHECRNHEVKQINSIEADGYNRYVQGRCKEENCPCEKFEHDKSTNLEITND